jgi:hypothetical protein
VGVEPGDLVQSSSEDVNLSSDGALCNVLDYKLHDYLP